MLLSYFVSLMFIGIAQRTSADVQASTKYKFTPESRHIDINDGQDYVINFEETGETDFDHCYYQSGTIAGDYPIVKNKSRTASKVGASNDLDTNSDIKQCGFTLNNVDDKSPKKWTLSAHDKKTGQNYTETVTVSFFYNIQLFLNTINVLLSGGYYDYVIPGNITLKRCVVNFSNVTAQLDMNSRKVDFDGEVSFDLVVHDVIRLLKVDASLKARLSSLGGGRCGLRCTEAVDSDPRRLVLISTDQEGKNYRSAMTVGILSQDEDLTNRTQEVYLGSSATIHCGTVSDSSSDSIQQFCYLYNPKGELVWHDHLCEYELKLVTLDDLGTWRCTVGYRYIMDTLELTTVVTEKKRESVETWSQDGGDFYTIGCKLKNYDISSMSYCRFVRPDGKSFKVQTGAATDRYTTLSTDLDKGVCGLEIVKPLLEGEKGTWRCDASRSSQATGAYLTVEKPSTIPYRKQLQKIVNLDDAFTIECAVPYSSELCIITAPNGDEFEPSDKLRTNLGECVFAVDKATSEHNGTWTCSFSRENGVPDEKISVEVSISEVKILYGDAEVNLGEEVELICNTGGIPLEYCRFVSPAGLSYHLRKGGSQSGKITYHGRGLEYGDCGVKILKAEAADRGYWNCFIGAGRQKANQKTSLSARNLLVVYGAESGLSTAGSVGIALGCLVVLAGAGAFVFYKRRKQSTVVESSLSLQQTGRTSNESGHSADGIMPQTPFADYNTNNG